MLLNILCLTRNIFVLTEGEQQQGKQTQSSPVTHFLDPASNQKPGFTALTSSSSLGAARLLHFCCQAQSPEFARLPARLAGKADPAAKAQLCVGSAQELQFMSKLSPTLLLKYIQIWEGGAGRRSPALRKRIWFLFVPMTTWSCSQLHKVWGSLKGT